MSNQYSNKDFTGRDLSQEIGMDNLTIEGSCFSQEKPNSEILPPNLSGVTFIDCNLDNVLIPSGNTLVRCRHRKFQVQEDGLDWLVDDELNPVSIL